MLIRWGCQKWSLGLQVKHHIQANCDIELVAGTGIGEKIIGHRQKNFNSVLDDLQITNLPQVVSNWDGLSVE